MKIYVGHSTDFDYRRKLYEPLLESSLSEEHELVLPHKSEEFFESRRFLETECDLFMADVSQASTGLGIELGWADQYDVDIVCIAEEGSDPSAALKAVSEEVRFYSTPEELVELVKDLLEK